MKPHSTVDERWRSLQSATKYYHCNIILKLWSLLSRLTPDLTHTHTHAPNITQNPVSSKLRTFMYMQAPTQQYLRVHTANEGKFPTHSNTKTAGAIQEKAWTTYMVSLVSVQSIEDTFWPSCGSTITSKSYTHIWTFLSQCVVYTDRRPDRDVQKCIVFNIDIKVGSEIKT